MNNIDEKWYLIKNIMLVKDMLEVRNACHIKGLKQATMKAQAFVKELGGPSSVITRNKLSYEGTILGTVIIDASNLTQVGNYNHRLWDTFSEEYPYMVAVYYYIDIYERPMLVKVPVGVYKRIKSGIFNMHRVYEMHETIARFGGGLFLGTVLHNTHANVRVDQIFR